MQRIMSSYIRLLLLSKFLLISIKLSKAVLSNRLRRLQTMEAISTAHESYIRLTQVSDVVQVIGKVYTLLPLSHPIIRFQGFINAIVGHYSYSRGVVCVS
jgi:hypothetical protein